MTMPSRYLVTIAVLLPEAAAQTAIVVLACRWIGRQKKPALWHKRLLVLFVVLMAAAFFSRFDFFDPFFDRFPGYVIGALQTAANLWLFSSTAAFFVYTAMTVSAGRTSHAPRSGRRAFLAQARNAVTAAPFIITAAGANERTRFEVTELPLALDGPGGQQEEIRLLQISDIHLGPYLSAADLMRVIGISNELKPDIAFVTGDLITQAEDPLDVCLQLLSRLRADGGVFGCMGNHERYAGVEDYATKEGARLGIRFLRHERSTVRLGGQPIHISGVDYESFENRPHYLKGAEGLAAPAGTNILLSHNPDVFPAAARLGFDLTLAGHTHGGQVTVEILRQTLNPARMLTPFVSGLYRRENKFCYVNRGIGTLGIPVRIACSPEITLIRLFRRSVAAR